MATLYLVRHGEAAAGFDGHHDPGLSEDGRAQAGAMAADLAPRGPLPIIVSPLQRALETAAALEAIWSAGAARDPRVAEIPSPTTDLHERTRWLRSIMPGRWSELDDGLRAWRSSYLAALHEQARDSVVVTHFIGINAAVGSATDDDRVVCFAPANCSVTIVETLPDGGDVRLRLVETGDEASTVVR